MATEFNIIPGNIKQQMLPFLLKPNASMNKDGSGYRSTDPLYFTFRKNGKFMISGKGILNFCPKTMKDHFKDDISYLLIYKYNKDNKGNPTELVTFDSLLDNIPAILIREYLPDTALELAITFFTSLIKEVMSMFGDKGISVETQPESQADQAQKSTDELKTDILKQLWNVSWFIMKYITGAETNDGSTNAATNLPSAASTSHGDFTSSCTVKSGSKHYSQILRFPHMLYYRLQSCTTTGIYELPYFKQDKKLYSSNGAAGWNVDDSSGWRLNSFPGSDMLFGKIFGKIFGNIGVSWTPWWDPTSGNETAEPLVDITFDLFNDTNDAALYNFIFVNTIVPNNKWIQYGLFLHSSHVYDIKLEGYNRLFACTGLFDVTYDGVLRDPPPNWFQNDGPLADHINSNINKSSFLTSLQKNKLIKIPDIYRVKLVFNSLLPANFNNYLYTLVMNDNHIDKYYFKTRDESLLPNALVGAFSGLLKGAKKAFEKGSGQDYVPTSLKLK